MNARHLLKLLGAALLVMATNVGLSIVYVALYANFINPGHPAAFYQAYAQEVAPYSSIIAGMPLMFLLGWWLSRRWLPSTFARNSALGTWLIYTLIDLAVLFSAGMTARLAVLSTISHITKLLAVLLGVRVGVARGESD